MLKGTGTLASKSRLTALYGRAESSSSQPLFLKTVDWFESRSRETSKEEKKDSSGFFLGKEVERKRERKRRTLPIGWNGLLLFRLWIFDRVPVGLGWGGKGSGAGSVMVQCLTMLTGIRITAVVEEDQ